MRYFADIFLSLVFVVGVCSCAHPRPAASAPTHPLKHVTVASIANDLNGKQVALQIASVLDKAGIRDYTLAGSSRLDITVRADEQAAATRLLKQDAQIHKYEITFY